MAGKSRIFLFILTVQENRSSLSLITRPFLNRSRLQKQCEEKTQPPVTELLMYTRLNFAKGAGTVFITTRHFMWRAEGILGLNLFNFSNSLYFGQRFFKNTK